MNDALIEILKQLSSELEESSEGDDWDMGYLGGLTRAIQIINEYGLKNGLGCVFGESV